MADLFVSLDTSKAAGERLAPEVRAEIQLLAPSNVPNGSISTAKLAPDAVTGEKIADDAVGSDQIAAGAVGASELATGAVGTSKLADNSVTPAKMGTGRVAGKIGSVDTSLTLVCVTAAEYAAITTPDSTVLYFVT